VAIGKSPVSIVLESSAGCVWPKLLYECYQDMRGMRFRHSSCQEVVVGNEDAMKRDVANRRRSDDGCKSPGPWGPGRAPADRLVRILSLSWTADAALLLKASRL
jgi:hypothetical protein